MAIQPKGDFEVIYGGPWSGLDYSRPANMIDQTALAPGTVNTQQINGHLCSSPWVASSPYSTNLAVGEFVIGVYQKPQNSAFYNLLPFSVVVTNIAVYHSSSVSLAGTTLPKPILTLMHTWTVGEINMGNYSPGMTVSFVAVNTGSSSSVPSVFFTGLMLNGVFLVKDVAFSQATGYVCGEFITEMAGRLLVGQTNFPTGGGPSGTVISCSVAWSGVGIYGQSWDGNAAHDVWNPANSAFFNGNIGGFNLLSDVADSITGLCPMGRSVIILHQQGISQQDPNSSFSTSGVQPFVWYHLWNSPQGVGAFPGTVAQYGQQVSFLSSDNTYSLSLSGGLAPFGHKIIPKIMADKRTADLAAGLLTGHTGVFGANCWYVASVVPVAGQLHYLLGFSSFTVTPSATSPTFQSLNTFMYDFNFSESSWSLVDLSKYFSSTTQGAGFGGFSYPISSITDALTNASGSGASSIQINSNVTYLLFGGFVGFGSGTLTSVVYSGQLFQLVAFDYDFNGNPITPYIAALFSPLSVPQSTIVFREEVISLGHKITAKRLRIQANNAPLPTVVANAQQQAQVTFTGSTSAKSSQPIPMQGNAAPTAGTALKTYYGDPYLSDEMIQATLQSVVTSPTNAWQSLAAFRIANASLIGTDATGSTQ